MLSVSSGSPLRRIAHAVLPAAAAVAFALGLAACGGEESHGDVEGILDRAFRTPIRSADLNLDAKIAVQGLQGFDRPVRIQAVGPYIGGRRALPKLDIDLRIGAQGAGQTVESGLLSTGDRAFVKFGGEFYEQSRVDVERANRELRGDSAGVGGTLRSFGLDPRRWVVDAEDRGTEKIGGVEARHVSGRLDTRRLFRDLNRLVERSANAIGGRSAGVPDPLSRSEIDRLAEIVRSPSFDVYVGEQDDIVRRVSASLEVSVPEADRARLGGVEGGSLRFTVELTDVNGEQQVEAPARSRPIADLTKQLGGLGTLGAQSGGRGAAPGGAAPLPRGGEGAAQSEADALRRYSECLDRAGPDDTKALSRCRRLLR